MEHLNYMDHLKASVYLQAYGQKDPVIEYKREAKKSFQNFFPDLREKIQNYLTYVDIAFMKDMAEGRFQTETEKQAEQAIEASSKTDAEEKKKEPIKKGKTIGRNEPCPCNSGKKYKNCCGRGK
jgi:preprotein translocase subunit SecA